MSPLAVVATALAGAVVAFVIAELITRAWLAKHGRYFIWPPWSRTRMELDREALPMLERTTRIEINADGERGDPPPARGERAYRVLVTGGSVAECYFLDQDTAWPAVIQRILNQPENRKRLGVERVHVGNVARSLVTCRHVAHMLAKTLPRYPKLDAIVLMVGASDLVYWLEQRTPPVLDDSPPPASQVFGAHPEGPFGWTHRNLALRRLASQVRRRWFGQVDVRERAGKRLTKARAMRANAREILREVPDPAPLLAHFDQHFRELVALARTKADRVIVVRQPWFEKEFSPEEARQMWNFGAGRPYEGEVHAYYAHDVVWKLMRLIDARATEIVRETGVEEIDLMPLLERNLDIYYDELHHTPKGCAIVGEIVARAILARTPDASAGTASTRAGTARQDSHAEVT